MPPIGVCKRPSVRRVMKASASKLKRSLFSFLYCRISLGRRFRRDASRTAQGSAGADRGCSTAIGFEYPAIGAALRSVASGARHLGCKRASVIRASDHRSLLIIEKATTERPTCSAWHAAKAEEYVLKAHKKSTPTSEGCCRGVFGSHHNLPMMGDRPRFALNVDSRQAVEWAYQPDIRA